MEKKLKYPIGIQSFEKLRMGGYIYIDKTKFFPALFENDYYFMSRPRRFGKSLLLSTLEAYFKGRKDLFKGLAIDSWEHEWIEYPVIRIDFAAMPGHNTKELLRSLRHSMIDTAVKYGIYKEDDGWDLSEYSIGGVFSSLIDKLFAKYRKGVVILIDEYDKGLIETIHDEQMLSDATNELRPFFSVLKSRDESIKFAFVTGVSRFHNTTIFSGANNLMDISMEPDFASICGITQAELEEYFASGIKNVSERYGMSLPDTLHVLKDKYDGYRFSEAEEYVYNPFSLLRAFRFGRLDDYWVMSGTSMVLAQYLKGSGFSLDDLTSKMVSANILGMAYSRENPISLFYQTGYLTIREADFSGSYLLGIPNQEVQAALADLLIPMYVTGYSERGISDLRLRLNKAISDGDVDEMMKILRSLLASVPFHEIDVHMLEKHMHLCMYMVFMMLGTSAKCEVATASGRIDMVASTPWRVYVFEFKIDGSAESALLQIDEKGYAIPWEANGRIVTKVGVNFSSLHRTIDSWVYA